jgi:hypothetical protein
VQKKKIRGCGKEMEGGSLKLTRSSFEESEIERCGLGGGFIPVAEDDNGNFQVLLGRERFVSHWKGSCRWSSFEGSRKEGESLSDASIREFCEETMCLLHSYDETKRIVVDESFWIRIVLKIVSERRLERYHSLYVVQVPFDPTLPTRFSNLRMQIEQIDRLQQDMQLSFPEFLRGVGEIGEICSDEDGTQILSEFAPSCANGGWSQVHGGYSTNYVSECQRRLLAFENLRERLGSAIDNCEHACVRVSRGERWGKLQNITIDPDYLEKDLIRWWSVPELQEILNGRGSAGTTRFRPYFLPVLQTLLEELAALSDRENPPERDGAQRGAVRPAADAADAACGGDALAARGGVPGDGGGDRAPDRRLDDGQCDASAQP